MFKRRYRPGPLTQIFDEVRRQQFQRAVHDGLDVERAVTILVQLRTGHTHDEISTRLWLSLDCPASNLHDFMGQNFPEINFLVEQRRVDILKTKRRGRAVYKAARNAVEDLIHRLDHQGEPLPPVRDDADPDAKRRQLAHQQIEAALSRGGWRQKGKGKTRLRVI
jgi:hypothetical protein